MGQALHRKGMDYYRQYMIVGGMPQAVNAYVESRDFTKVDQVKRDILALYRADIAKHAAGGEMKVTFSTTFLRSLQGTKEDSASLPCEKGLLPEIMKTPSSG